MDGLLLIDKPLNWTSFDVVNKVRRTISNSSLATTNRKRFPVGHTGTLDPLATGLLVLAVGTYTKRVAEISKLDKTYEAELRLGQASTTDDAEGERTEVSDRQPTEAELKSAVQQFIGTISQVPPQYSAIKVDGQRAYKAARKGANVALKPRPVTVHSLELVSYNYPVVTFRTTVSSGTYIRSLAVDIGKELEVGAYLTALRRVSVGQWSVEDAIAPDAPAEAIAKQLLTLP